MHFLARLFGTHESSLHSLSTEPSPTKSEAFPQATEPQEAKFPFAIGALTEKGPHRERNEDALFCLQSILVSGANETPFGIFLLADGLGGHEDGQLASELAVRTVAAHLVKTIYIPLLGGHAQDSQSVPMNDSLTKAIAAANQAIKTNTAGGGSTLTGTLILGNTACVVHVGDSRAYLISDSTVNQLTHDHSVIGRLMELDRISPEEAAANPQRHLLYKAIGQQAAVEPDISYHSIRAGTHLLLCSDGLWDAVSEEDMLESIQRSRDPQVACTSLVRLAIAQGSDDNISVIILSSRS